MKYSRTKDEIMKCLGTRIEEEKQFVLASLKAIEDDEAEKLATYRNDTLDGRTELGKHYGDLVELERRFKDDAREKIDLTSKDFETIIDGANSGIERLARTRVRSGINKINRLLNEMGIPPMPQSLVESLVRCEECDDPDCRLHGKNGLAAVLGIKPDMSDQEEPVGKVGTVEQECCDSQDPEDCDPAISQDTPESVKRPVGAKADAS